MILTYDNANFNYIGRFLTPTVGMQSAFNGSQIRFRVRGTTSIIVTAAIKDTSADVASVLYVNVDNSADSTSYYFSTNAETATTDRSVTITLPDTNEHEIILKMSSGWPLEQYALTSYIRFKTITIDDTGEILPALQTGKKLLMLGDSWMGNTHDWPRLMDRSKYAIYPVAFAGAKASHINAYYPYQAAGINKYGDPAVDAAVICLGVNDAIQGVTTASYKTDIGALIDKVRVDHASAPIFILQAPKNAAAAQDYSMFGTVLSELATEKSNVHYITTQSLWASLTWLPDNAHLNAAGKTLFANFMTTTLDTFFAPVVPEIIAVDYVTIGVGLLTYTLPIYSTVDLVKNELRIRSRNGVNSLKLVDSEDVEASNIRIKTENGIFAVAKL